MTTAARPHGLFRLGAFAAMLMAALYAVIAVSYAFLPKNVKVVGTGDPAAYYPALLKNPSAALLLDWEFGVLGIVGVAVVVSVSGFSRRNRNEGWILYTSVLALFGFLIMSVDSLKGSALHKLRAEAWMHGDAATRAAIGATRLTLDYYAWFACGAVGAWILVVNIAMLRNRQLPTVGAALGFVLAGANELIMVSLTFAWMTSLDLAVAAGLLAAVPWLAFVGIRLWRASAPQLRALTDQAVREHVVDDAHV
ncbi:hypothetical protein [Mycobacterium sp.]|uniref:hypothetical protein n=1 Tax=Mycobacterium sp. TaxID=1785 RepID=UPI0031D69E75